MAVMYWKICTIFLLYFFFSIDSMVVQVSNPFDPFRLECPNRNGIMKLTLQRIESMGGLRSDQVISSYCESLAKLFPSPRDGSSPDHVVQDCHSATSVVMNFKSMFYRKKVADGQNQTLSLILRTLFVEEIDDEFIANARAKLDQWFAAQEKNRTKSTKGKTKSINEPKKPEETRLPSIKTDISVNQHQAQRVIGPPAVTPSLAELQRFAPPGFFNNRLTPPPGQRTLTNSVTPNRSLGLDKNKKATVEGPSALIRAPNSVVAKPAVSAQPPGTSTTKRGKSKNHANKTGTTLLPLLTSRGPTTVRPTTRIVTATVSSSGRPITAPPIVATTNRAAVLKVIATTRGGVGKLPTTTRGQTLTPAVITPVVIGGTTEETSSEEQSEPQPVPRLAFPRVPLHAEDLARFNSLQKKPDTAAKLKAPPLSLEFPGVVHTVPVPTGSTDDNDVIYVDVTTPTAATEGFSNEVEYYYYYEDGSPASAKPFKTTKKATLKSTMPSTTVAKSIVSTSQPTKSGTVSNISTTLTLSSSGTTSRSNVTASIRSITNASLSTSGSTTLTSARSLRTNSTDDSSLRNLSTDALISSNKPLPPAPPAPTQLPLPPSPPSFAAPSTQSPNQIASGNVLCDTRQAAVSSETGLVIACGQGTDIWTPPRCPRDSFCLESSNSNFRVCCPAQFVF